MPNPYGQPNQPLVVSVGSTSRTIPLANVNVGTPAWQKYYIPFTAGAAQTTVAFTNPGGTGFNGGYGVIDLVSLGEVLTAVCIKPAPLPIV